MPLPIERRKEYIYSYKYIEYINVTIGYRSILKKIIASCEWSMFKNNVCCTAVQRKKRSGRPLQKKGKLINKALILVVE